MSDGSLSQDEIDALLQGGDMGGSSAPSSAAGGNGGLSAQEIADFTDVIKELLPSQAQNLSNMVGDTVEMTSPQVEVVSRDDLIADLPENVVEVSLNFQDQVSGNHSYLIGPEAATTIAGLMMGQEEVDLNEAALSAIEEAANTLAGTAATTFGEKSGKSAMTSPGETKNVEKNEIGFFEDTLVKVSYQTKIDGKEPSEFVEVFALDLVKAIVGIDAMDELDAMAGLDMGGMNQPAMGGGKPPASGGMGGMANLGAAMGQSSMGSAMGGMDMFGSGQPVPNVQGLQFPSLNPQSSSGEQGNIGLLMDVYMEMTVELGRTKKLIKEILGMGEGTIIELDKLAGEPVDILVNHKLIAKGEVVVIDENFGVRVTEIVSPIDRVDSLG